MIRKMATASRFDPSSFPDSPYAAELQRDPANLRFSPRLEREYTLSQLVDERSLIRVVAVITAFVGMVRGAELGFRIAWTTTLLVDFSVVIAGSVILALIAWSPSFDRFYLPWARVIVPVRNESRSIERTLRVCPRVSARRAPNPDVIRQRGSAESDSVTCAYDGPGG